MAKVVAAVAVVLALLVAPSADAAGRAPHRPIQPMGLAYRDDGTGLAPYDAPGALIIAGRSPQDQARYAALARRGVHVLLYLDPVVVNPDGRYHALLFAASPCGPAVAPWPGLPPASRYGPLADFRPGGVLAGKLACVLETMVAENPEAAGWFADDVGSRSWFPGLDWARLSPADRSAYRDGAVELVRSLRTVADRHRLLVVVNGTWTAHDGGGYPDPAVSGNALADGGMVEHHDGQLAFFAPYACSAQWARDSAVTRGLAVNLVLTRSVAQVHRYADTGCFAYAAAQEDYGAPPPPWGPFTPTDLPTGPTSSSGRRSPRAGCRRDPRAETSRR